VLFDEILYFLGEICYTGDKESAVTPAFCRCCEIEEVFVMKKYCLMLAAALLLSVFVGCMEDGAAGADGKDGNGITSIVLTGMQGNVAMLA
jgi:hypothetical protein